MADRAKKKEKHRLKRAKKQRAIRKASAITPLQFVARHGGELECHITRNWEMEGIANIFVLATTPDGRHAFAAFLVDAWCVGLKDSWGFQQITREEFDDLLERANRGSPVAKADPEVLRKLVAGAIRFSRQNGFKLPAGWEKWAGIFGDLGDIANADLSRFGKDGDLFYIGAKKFLRERLIGSTPEAFLARPDVKFMLRQFDPDDAPAGFDISEEFEEGFAEDEDQDGDEDQDEDQDENEDEDAGEPLDGFDELPMDELINQVAPGLSEVLGATVEETMATVTETLHRRHITPHPRLEEAMGYVASLAITARTLQSLGMEPPSLEDCREAIEDLMDLNKEPDRESLWEAIEQVNLAAEADAKVDLKAMLSFPTPPAC